MLWVKLTIDKLDNPTRGDHKLRPKGQSHRRKLADKLSTSPALCYQRNTQVPLQELATEAACPEKLSLF